MIYMMSITGASQAVKQLKYSIRNRPASSLIILPLIIQIIVLLSSNLVEATNYDEANESHYDPERETDGLARIVSAPSRSSSPPLFKMGQSGESEVEDIEQVSRQPVNNRKSPLQKRSDDQEQEDDVDDEDRDEDKSGSSHHDSYESPAFGESQKAAQDGEDIERFFDTHLGPQEPAPAESSSSNQATTPPAINDQVSQLDSSSVKLDSPEDQYVAAASSPLSDIFHTLIKAHRRPIVIHATDDAPRGAATAAASSSNNVNSPVQSDSSVASASTGTVGSVGVPLPMSFDHSTAAGIIQAAATAAVAPLTLFAPVGAHSSPLSTSGYEQHVPSPAASSSPQSGEEQTGPVRVYIARRPSFFSQFRALAPAITASASSGGHRLMQQSSDAHWRGVPRYVQMDQRPYNPASHYAESQDYSRYPVMANSYTNHRGYMPTGNDPAQASSADDESGTVSYNLSFGGGSSVAAAPEEDSTSADPESNPMGYRQSSNLHQEYPQQAYNHPQQAYGQGYSPMQGYSSTRGRHPSSTQAYNNYYQQQPGTSAASHGPRGQQRGNSQPAHQFQGSRFHKDVSESGAQPLNYVQVYSSNNEFPKSKAQQMAIATRSGPRNRFWGESGSNSMYNRQRLLASLDEEIKSSPYYTQDSTSPAQLYAQRSAINLHKKSKSRLGQDKGDGAELVSYSSFHSEADPHKSFTTSSELVTEPEPDNSMQRNSHRAPSKDNNNNQSGDKRKIESSSNLSHVGPTTNDKIDYNHQHFNGQDQHTATTKDRMRQQQQQQHQQHVNKGQEVTSNLKNLATGPLTKETIDLHRLASNNSMIILRYSPQGKLEQINNRESDASCNPHKRVRREDAEDREAEDADDDGVWVDDDEDDDNRQTASDLSATTQEPLEDDDNDQEASVNDDATSGGNHHHHHISGGILGGPHSYELANDR